MQLVMDMYTGGLFETNSYYVKAARLLVDAPEGVASWLLERGYKVETLLLTHGHVDHVWDAAQVQKQHGCEVVYHRDTAPMVTDPDFFARAGFPWRVEPLTPGSLVEEKKSVCWGGMEFEVLEVPGHCPGSLCFLRKEDGVLFGGDVLFSGSVGRWDLPGGDRELLLRGIRDKLLPLGDGIRVLPGHGPATTIGQERVHNPYIEP